VATARLVLVWGLTLAGCIRAAGSVAQPTAIERQLLGAYRELDDELVYAASLRSEAVSPSSDVDPRRQAALRQRVLQRFNAEDLEVLLDAGCLAEGLDARVVPVPCPKVEEDLWVRVRARVVKEENQSRDVIIEWAASVLSRREGDPEPSPERLEEVRLAYRNLVRAAARPGHLFEVEPGRYEPAP
jgi:hypothetical protein